MELVTQELRAKKWFLAARPKTLWAAAVPVIVGSVIAFEAGLFDSTVFLVTLGAAILIQIGTNFANDLYDFKRGADASARKGPLRITQAGLVSPGEMLAATVLVLSVALLLGLYLVSVGGLPILIIGSISLILAFLYSTGPIPLSYRGLAEPFVFLFFGPVAVAGTYYLFSHQISSAAIWAGVGCGLISTAILVVNNLRDIEGDRLAGKNTLAVRFGENFAKAEYVVLLVAAAHIPIIIALSSGHSWAALGFGYLIAAMPCIKRVLFGAVDQGLNEVLAGTGKLLLLYGALLCLGYLI